MKKFKSAKNLNLEELWTSLKENDSKRNLNRLQAIIDKRIASASRSATLVIATENSRESNKVYGPILSEIRRKL